MLANLREQNAHAVSAGSERPGGSWMGAGSDIGFDLIERISQTLRLCFRKLVKHKPEVLVRIARYFPAILFNRFVVRLRRRFKMLMHSLPPPDAR